MGRQTTVAEPATTSAESDLPEVDAGASLHVHQCVEAVLLTSERAMSTARIGLATDASAADIESAIEQLNDAYESGGHVMRVQRVAGGW